MATFKAEVYAHQKRADGTYNIKIRVIHQKRKKYIPTTYYVTKDDLTRTTFKLKKPQMSVLAKRNTNLFSTSVREDISNIPYVEGLIHTTLKPGLIVRSKSEVIIANMLYERGIDFEYERMIEDNGRRCIPDFTFEDASGDTILWEHLGMLDNPAYKESWEKKRDFYKSIGYIEGVNLFTTVDHENGSIDSTEIAAIVDKLEDLI